MNNLDLPIRPSKGRSTGHPFRNSRGLDALNVVVLVAVFLVIRAHVALGLSAPLWLDESWTAAIASVDSFGELIHQAHEEAGGPIYYLLIWSWAKIFGISDTSLHFPSLFASLFAPLLGFIGMMKTRKLTAIIWAVLIATWIPGIMQSGMARCYSVLLCISVVSNIMHIRLLAQPTQRNSILWSTISTIFIMTHYHASFIVLVQFFSIVLVHGRKALRLTPSTMVFTLAVAWIGWSLPRLALMASPDYAWIKTLSIFQLPIVFSYILGLQNYVLLLVLIVVFLVCALVRQRLAAGETVDRTDSSTFHHHSEVYAGMSSLIALAIVICLSMWRPILELRYLTPFVPGVLLLGSLWLEHISGGHRSTVAIMISFLLLLSSNEWISHWHLGARDFNYETASEWLSEKPTSKLVFYWDNPTALTVARDQMDLVGSVFLRRMGINVRGYTIYPHIGSNMNNDIDTIISSESDLIWLYDTGVSRTTAIDYPPRISEMRPDLECQDFGKDRIGIYACRPR